MDNIEEESKESMYERTNHGTVDESSSEQQIRESDDYTVIMAENWNPSTSGTGSYGRQAGRPAGRPAGRRKTWSLRDFQKPVTGLQVRFQAFWIDF